MCKLDTMYVGCVSISRQSCFRRKNDNTVTRITCFSLRLIKACNKSTTRFNLCLPSNNIRKSNRLQLYSNAKCWKQIGSSRVGRFLHVELTACDEQQTDVADDADVCRSWRQCCTARWRPVNCYCRHSDRQTYWPLIVVLLLLLLLLLRSVSHAHTVSTSNAQWHTANLGLYSIDNGTTYTFRDNYTTSDTSFNQRN